MRKAKLKINKDFPARKLKKGTILQIEVDKNNIPLDLYWRRRVKDSEIDDCVEIVNKSISTVATIENVNKPKKENK